jgi:NAD(P)H-hydrate repair Nnr-like enzyme with NAD(P)H-hydrate dehydratase domain
MMMLTSVWALTTSRARRRGARPYTGATRPAAKATELMGAITVMVAITEVGVIGESSG